MAREGKWAMGDAQARAGGGVVFVLEKLQVSRSTNISSDELRFLSPNSVMCPHPNASSFFFLHEERMGLGRKIHATLQEHVGTRVLRFLLTVLHPREGPGKQCQAHRRTHSQSVSSCIGNT